MSSRLAMFAPSIIIIYLCVVLCTVDAGVKIEISRVKEPRPKAEAPSNAATDDKTVPSEVAAAAAAAMATDPNEVATTVPTTFAIDTTTMMTKSMIETNFKLLSNSTTTTSVDMTTTMIPPNVTDPMKPAQPNISNTVPMKNATSFQSPYLSEFTRREMRRKLIPPDYYCPCDLKINFCDINCCCDIDCASKEIMQTLKCTERDWSIHDYEESSELQLCSQTRHFSLFCIVDTTRKRKQSRKRDFMVQRVNIMSVAQHKWPNQFDQTVEVQNNNRDYYKFGDSILIWDESNEEIKTLDIPWSFGASDCHINVDIQYLMDDEIECVQSLDEHDQFIDEFQDKLKSVKILKHPKPIDTPAIVMMDFCQPTSITNQTENCTEAEIYHCIETIALRTCHLEANQSMAMPELGANFRTNELSIQIHHNFTNILNVTVFFVYHEYELNGSDFHPEHLVQKIRIEYLELNETFSLRDVHQVSGNIGYLLHHPVIVSKLVRQNESNVGGGGLMENPNSKFVLSYFNNETNCTNDDHYLKLPISAANGDCTINKFTFQTINFGERSRTKCNAMLMLNDFNDSSDAVFAMNLEQNHTHTCRSFQMQIFNYLLHDFELENVNSTVYNRFNLRVSEMGNPKNDSEHWIDVNTIRPPDVNDIVATTGGSGSTGTDANGALEFTCTNMVLGLRYEFFYGTMLIGKISNQPLIKVAQIQFSNRINLKFKLDDDVPLKVPLYIDVMFYDFSRIVSNAGHAYVRRIDLLLTMLSLPIFIWWFI